MTSSAGTSLRSKRLSRSVPRYIARSCVSLGLAAIAVCVGPHCTENASANGDTRTIILHHTHTGEDITATFRKDGVYDKSVLAQLNHFLRDWRNDDQTNMDPRLFDVVWAAYRESGSKEPIAIVSAYRSPQTNAMLRRRSKAVAEHSQHMLGKAMDMHYEDVPMSRIREIGMRLQRGGVGYYPTSGTPFVHLDVGNVRYWPRMSYDQLARLFPDGKAVFMASDGRTLPRFEEARAEIEARGDGFVAVASDESGSKSKGFFARLFGLGGRDDEDSEDAVTPEPSRRNKQLAQLGQATGIGPVQNDATPGATSGLSETRAQEAYFARQKEAKEAAAAAAAAQKNLPKGQTFAAPAPQTASASEPPPAPLPPRRPADLIPVTPVVASVETAAPLPPSRPINLQGLRGTTLPSVITQGTPNSQGLNALIEASTPHASAPPPAALLAYAPASGAGSDDPASRNAALTHAAAPVLSRTIGLRAAAGQRKASLVAARLDRSNFSRLISAEPLGARSVRGTFAASILPLRAAARLDAVALGFAGTALLPCTLSTKPVQPAADHFVSASDQRFASN